MNKLSILIFLLCISLSVTNTFGQETNWKKKLKKMTPEELKALKNENDSLKSLLTKKDRKIKNLNKEIKSLKTKAPSGTKSENNIYKEKEGVIFKVQIGAFRNKDLQKYFDNSKNFSGTVDEDGLKKYTLGNFNEYWEANKFKKYLREMGVNDAWVVAYKNGKRIPMKDALEGVVK